MGRGGIVFTSCEFVKSIPLPGGIVSTSNNNNIGHGGDTFMIQISNKWTMSNAYNWDVVSGATNTISSIVNEKMADNGDGTYSYNYSVNNYGAITVIVKQTNAHGLDWVWYSNYDWTGTPQLVNTIKYYIINEYLLLKCERLFSNEFILINLFVIFIFKLNSEYNYVNW